MSDDEAVPLLADDIEVHSVEDGCVVYVRSTDDVHFLNAAAMYVLDLCDGQLDVAAIARECEEVFGTGGGREVRRGILSAFSDAGIVRLVEAE